MAKPEVHDNEKNAAAITLEVITKLKSILKLIRRTLNLIKNGSLLAQTEYVQTMVEQAYYATAVAEVCCNEHQYSDKFMRAKLIETLPKLIAVLMDLETHCTSDAQGNELVKSAYSSIFRTFHEECMNQLDMIKFVTNELIAKDYYD